MSKISDNNNTHNCQNLYQPLVACASFIFSTDRAWGGNAATCRHNTTRVVLSTGNECTDWKTKVAAAEEKSVTLCSQAGLPEDKCIVKSRQKIVAKLWALESL